MDSRETRKSLTGVHFYRDVYIRCLQTREEEDRSGEFEHSRETREYFPKARDCATDDCNVCYVCTPETGGERV